MVFFIIIHAWLSLQRYFKTFYELKNSVALETGILCSQPFMNSHFQFLITMQSTVSHVLRQWPK